VKTSALNLRKEVTEQFIMRAIEFIYTTCQSTIQLGSVLDSTPLQGDCLPCKGVDEVDDEEENSEMFNNEDQDQELEEGELNETRVQNNHASVRKSLRRQRKALRRKREAEEKGLKDPLAGVDGKKWPKRKWPAISLDRFLDLLKECEDVYQPIEEEEDEGGDLPKNDQIQLDRISRWCEEVVTQSSITTFLTTSHRILIKERMLCLDSFFSSWSIHFLQIREYLNSVVTTQDFKMFLWKDQVKKLTGKDEY